MSDSTSKFATAARFISLAFLSFLLCTGGFWVYQNRENLGNGFKDARQKGSVIQWLVRAAGGNPDEIISSKPFEIEFKPAFETNFELGKQWMEDFNKGFLYNPDK